MNPSTRESTRQWERTKFWHNYNSWTWTFELLLDKNQRFSFVKDRFPNTMEPMNRSAWYGFFANHNYINSLIQLVDLLSMKLSLYSIYTLNKNCFRECWWYHLILCNIILRITKCIVFRSWEHDRFTWLRRYNRFILLT